MKPIDPEKAEGFRKEWERMAIMWEKEAESRKQKAKTDAAKYHATHMKAAKDAARDAKHFRDLIANLDAVVAAHEAAGKVGQ